MKKVFLCCMAVLCNLLFFSSGSAQSSRYVNDHSISGDGFTFAVGNDAHSGSAVPGFVSVKAEKAFVKNASGSVQGSIDAIGTGTKTINFIAGTTTSSGEEATNSGKHISFSPGSISGCVTLNGNMELNSGDALTIALNGTTIYTQDDQFTVNGTVTLGDASLNITLGYTPVPANRIVLINNDGTDPVNGTFVQGATITVGDYTYSIIYNGDASGSGSGNDVILELVPTITCPSNVTSNTDAGVCTAVVNNIAPTATTGIGTSYAYAITGTTTASGSGDASGVTFNKGLSTVTYTITDAASNTATCSFDVTVEDNTVPQFTKSIGIINPDFEILYKTGSTSITTTQPLPNGGFVNGNSSVGLTGNTLNFSDNTSGNIFDIAGWTWNTANAGLGVTREDGGVNFNTTQNQIFFINGNIYDGGTAEKVITQTLTETVEQGATYKLSADFGWRQDNEQVTGPQILRLYAGNTLLTPVSVVAPALVRGSFVTHTNTYYISNLALVGSLRIELGLGAQTDGSQLNIDHVVLNKSSASVCPLPSQTRNTIVGQCTYTAVGTEFDPFGFTDNCSGATLSNDFNSSSSLAGAVFPTGTTTVIWTVTDASGNTSTCSINVTVNDVTPPVFLGGTTITAHYYKGTNFETYKYSEGIQQIYYNWPNGSSPNFSLLGTDYFSIRYQISFLVPTTGTYTFKTVSDDGVRLYVNGTLIIDNWTVHSPTTNTGTINLTAGQTIPIVLEFFENQIGAIIRLSYTAPGAAEQYMTSSLSDITTTTSADGIGNCSAEVAISDLEISDNCSGATLQHSLSGATTRAITNGQVGTVAFSKGITTITYIATDATGNTTTLVRTVTVTDDENPTLAAATDVNVSTDEGTCAASVAISDATFGDNCPGESLTWVMTGATTGNGTGQVGTYSFNKGVTTITYTVTDASGRNASDAMTVTVTDDENPTINCVDDITVNNDSGACGAIVTYTVPTASDNCSFGTNELIVNGSFEDGTFTGWTAIDNPDPFGPWTVSTSINYFWSPISPVAGAYLAGNGFEGGAGTAELYQDVTLPLGGGILSWSDQVDYFNFGGQDKIYEVQIKSTAGDILDTVYSKSAISGTLEDGDWENHTFDMSAYAGQTVRIVFYQYMPEGFAGPAQFALDNVSLITQVAAPVVQTAGLSSGSFFPIGTTTNTFVVTDASGNTATCSFDVIVEDNEDPIITCVDNQTRSTDEGECTYTVDGAEFDPTEFADNCSGATISNDFNSSNTLAGAEFNKDTTTVIWTVTDARGNTATCSFDIIIEDNEDPTITCVDNQTRSTDEGECTYTVDGAEFDPTEFTDNCSGATISNDFNSSNSLAGAVFNKGTTTVIWTVTDASGNTATCSFDVIIEDNEDPTVTATTAVTTTTSSDGTGNCSASVTITDATFNDNCSGSSIAYVMTGATVKSSTSGQVNTYTFNKGVTKIVYTVTDAAGNTAKDSMTVTVTDDEDPTITCISNKYRSTDAGQLYHTISGTEFDPTAYDDNCSATLSYKLEGVTTSSPEWVTSATLASVQLNFGVTTITWKATDEAGNFVTCSFEVNVDTVTTNINVGDIVVTPTTKQYSDSVVISAKVTPWPSVPTGPLSAPSGKMVFYIGTEKMGEATVSPLIAPDEVGYAEIRVPLLELQTILNYTNYNAGNPTNGPLKPGFKDIKAVFVSGSPDDYLNDTTVNPGALEITKENAIVAVDNSTSYFNASPTTYKGTVWFKAIVSDTADAAPVPAQGVRGDIRNATLQFLDGSGGLPGSPIGPSRNVGLFSASDKTTGQSLLTFDYTLNNTEIQAGGKSWIAWAEARNYYTGYDVRDANVVTLGLPGSEYVTGGGYYMTEQSGGLYPAQNGTRMNFGFNMKWNKTGKNLQGKINVIYRTLQNGKVRIFHIKSNAVDALAVSSTTFTDFDGISRQYNTALMTTQASLTDITDPYNPIGYSGNNNLKVVAWDNKLNGSTGEWDKLSVELYDSKTSQLLFASYTGGGTVSVRTIKTGNINVRNTSTVLTPDCAAPTNLTVEAISSNSATLGWTSGNSSLGDTLMYRKYGVGASWTVLTLPSGTPSQAIATDPGTLYEWRVKSVCSAGSSAWVYGSFTSLADCNAMPSQLQASNVTTSSANLAWSVNMAATGYKLEYRLLGSATFIEVNTLKNSYSLTGLDDDTTYEWQVSNTCSGGTTGSTSALSQFKTLSACGTQNLVATAVTATSARLNWDRALAATGYDIRWKDTSASATWNTISGVVYNYYDLIGLNPSTVYQFEVAPVCTGGQWATSTLFTTLAACGTPSGLQTLNITYSSSTLKWNAVAYATGYTVRYRQVNTSTWTESGLLSSTTTSYAVSGLTQQTSYEWSVKATCASGDGNWSTNLGFMTLQQVTCTAPTGLSATTYTGKTTVLLKWSGPTGASYKVEYRKSGVTTWTSTTTVNTSITLTLSKNTTYQWQVTSICSGVTGGTTAALSTFTIGSGLTTSSKASIAEMTIPEKGMNRLIIKAYPNPNGGRFNLSIKGATEGRATVKITDVYGTVVYLRQVNLMATKQIVPIQLANQANGMYLVEVLQGNQKTAVKITKD